MTGRSKRWVAAIAIALLGTGAESLVAARARTVVERGTCSVHGKKLYGKIRIVTAHADVTVQEVASFPDLKMKAVTAYPDRCGMWQLVESGADTTVKFVPAFADVRIQRVAAFPGLP